MIFAYRVADAAAATEHRDATCNRKPRYDCDIAMKSRFHQSLLTLANPNNWGVILQAVGLLAVLLLAWAIMVLFLSLLGVWLAAPLLIGFFTWATYRIRRQNQRERRVLDYRCAECGYDLRASPELCPECGRDARLDEPLWRQIRRKHMGEHPPAAAQAPGVAPPS